MGYNWTGPTSRARRRLRVGMLVGSASSAGGGVVEAVRSLAMALDRLPDVAVEVFAPDQGGRACDFGEVPVRLAPVHGPSSFAYAPRLHALMMEARLDVVHVHGLWMYLSVAARRWAEATGQSYIVSPHGMLEPWALRNSGAKKRLARILFEDAHLRGATCLHALCDAEAAAIRKAGIGNPVAVLPNGVDPPSTDPSLAAWRKAIPKEAKVLLFLGRVTPKKQAVSLIRAFASINTKQPWRLAIVGPVDPSHQEAIAAARASAPHPEHIVLAGPAYGEARSSAYASADAFILPSISEGLPMAALEAFANGLPALLTAQCNLPEAFASGAALEIGSTEQEIARGLRRLFTMPAGERDAMAEAARRLAVDAFDWDAIAIRMAGLYGYLSACQAQAPALLRFLTGRAGLPA